MITAVGGSAMMLAVNGWTWWKMYLAYRKLREARKNKKGKGGSSKKEL